MSERVNHAPALYPRIGSYDAWGKLEYVSRALILKHDVGRRRLPANRSARDVRFGEEPRK